MASSSFSPAAAAAAASLRPREAEQERGGGALPGAQPTAFAFHPPPSDLSGCGLENPPHHHTSHLRPAVTFLLRWSICLYLFSLSHPLSSLPQIASLWVVWWLRREPRRRALLYTFRKYPELVSEAEVWIGVIERPPFLAFSASVFCGEEA